MADTALSIASGLSGDSISMPGIHPSWTPEQTLEYLQNKDKNDSDLVTAMQMGMTPDNYMDIMSTRVKNGDEAAIEWLANKYATEQSEKTAREWTAQREDTAYQRLISDLSGAGISPYILSGATPAVSSSSGHSYSGSQMTSRANNKNTVDSNELRATLGLLGVILSATMLAFSRKK